MWLMKAYDPNGPNCGPDNRPDINAYAQSMQPYVCNLKTSDLVAQ